jgi:large subunit ribosomal protein L4
MKTQLFDAKGNKTKKQIELNDFIFGIIPNTDLIKQSVNVYLSNKRQSNAHTKDRSEVSGGGKKPWRQKGTGRARHGSSRSPIWKGGGVTFGPTNEVNHKLSMPKKMRKLAIRSAFSTKQIANEITVFEGIDIAEKQLTKSLTEIINNANLSGKTLIIVNDYNESLLFASSNISDIKVTLVNELNTFEILKYNNIIILQDALEIINDFWGEDIKFENIEVKE